MGQVFEIKFFWPKSVDRSNKRTKMKILVGINLLFFIQTIVIYILYYFPLVGQVLMKDERNKKYISIHQMKYCECR